jgi:hypothetical protein
MASRRALGVLVGCLLSAVCGGAMAQSQGDRGSNRVVPNVKGQFEPPPPVRGAEERSGEQQAPSAREVAPPAGHGCPDPGRKLELIV